MSGLFSPDITLAGWFDHDLVFSGQFDPDLSIWRFATLSLTEQSDTVSCAANVIPQVSLSQTESNDAGTAAGTVSVTGRVAAVESPQGLPGAFWNTRYWASRYWAGNYWTLNTTPNSVLVKASLSVVDTADSLSSGAFWSSNYWARHYWASGYWAPVAITNAIIIRCAFAVTEASDTASTAGETSVTGSLVQAESVDSLTAAGTAVGGVVGSVSCSLTAQEDDDALRATMIRVGAVLPAGSVGRWPFASAQAKRRAVAALKTVDGEDRLAVRVRSPSMAVARLRDEADRAVSVSRSTSLATLRQLESSDHVKSSGRVDWSDLIVQEDDALLMGNDNMLMAELLREAA